MVEGEERKEEEESCRSKHIDRLKRERFDLLVIGGGATGSGVALDAASRGLKAALVEGRDFSSETSSRSTKLVHGGVRYLEQAFLNLDREHYLLVKEALRERKTFLSIAPHLTRKLPIITPLYSWYQVPYLTIGLKLYDLLARDAGLGRSRYLSRSEVIQKVPNINPKGLKGGVLYYDGQFNDARMNVELACTAALHGAAVCNYLEVKELKVDQYKGRVFAAEVEDQISGKRFSIRAKNIVNATGPFSDSIRKMENRDAQPRIRGSRGTHIVLKKDSLSSSYGLLIPKTEDGRVLFLLPWEGNVLLGTTDEDSKIERDIQPQEKEIHYLIEHINRYLSHPIKEEEVASSWSGIRPLVTKGGVRESSEVCRDHVIEEGKYGLVSIMGGKWTTYRKMGEELVDFIVKRRALREGSSATKSIPLIGAIDYEKGCKTLRESAILEQEVIEHLLSSYGGKATEVVEIAKQGYSKRLIDTAPYIEAEVIYAVRREFAQSADDILSRRTSLSTIDQAGAERARGRVEELISFSIEQVQS